MGNSEKNSFNIHDFFHLNESRRFAFHYRAEYDNVKPHQPHYDGRSTETQLQNGNRSERDNSGDRSNEIIITTPRARGARARGGRVGPEVYIGSCLNH
ncbi:hypothetical protein EVAR_27244_1 [Eumeta japonica]|uniref:Uncharacterized protein n=1 Tax=Eumeta variegata TaxID=151549 RepID=A0A4C1VZ26_EUMVA|nr:hypothetical protein EVAR_27244_1 [Eumeta japonica]